MIRNLVRTCDLCHRDIPAGQYRQRNVDAMGLDFLVVLLENQEGFEMTENPDGTVGLDTCVNCYMRIGFNHSYSLN
jgi:hypothetical protein